MMHHQHYRYRTRVVVQSHRLAVQKGKQGNRVESAAGALNSYRIVPGIYAHSAPSADWKQNKIEQKLLKKYTHQQGCRWKSRDSIFRVSSGAVWFLSQCILSERLLRPPGRPVGHICFGYYLSIMPLFTLRSCCTWSCINKNVGWEVCKNFWLFDNEFMCLGITMDLKWNIKWEFNLD